MHNFTEFNIGKTLYISDNNERLGGKYSGNLFFPFANLITKRKNTAIVLCLQNYLLFIVEARTQLQNGAVRNEVSIPYQPLTASAKFRDKHLYASRFAKIVPEARDMLWFLFSFFNFHVCQPLICNISIVSGGLIHGGYYYGVYGRKILLMFSV
ncbi:hypothetical protein CEXT_20581 [Caerostris extrusa]|uniref:Uncharacterized protein n=1 Tax=Caerostris extrusa TaxID=172846 RepID=A0AAV4QNJ9_CAEEX|nr:hypothetical protein CEXT_20581 [Caerostris extrusa]